LAPQSACASCPSHIQPLEKYTIESLSVARLRQQAELLVTLSILHLTSETRTALADDNLSVNAYVLRQCEEAVAQGFEPLAQRLVDAVANQVEETMLATGAADAGGDLVVAVGQVHDRQRAHRRQSTPAWREAVQQAWRSTAHSCEQRKDLASTDASTGGCASESRTRA
jgi:hypothetical protein